MSFYWTAFFVINGGSDLLIYNVYHAFNSLNGEIALTIFLFSFEI